MSNTRKLKFPPIKHAILELRVQLPEQPDVQAMKMALEKHDMFEKVLLSRPWEAEFGISVGREGKTTTKQHFGEVNGAIAKSKDGVFVAAWLNDKCVFTQNGKYDSFETFMDGCRQSWESYAETCRPTLVRRIGLRYINQFKGPWTADAVKAFKSRPMIAADKFGLPSSFVQRSILAMPDRNASAVVNQSWRQLEQTSSGAGVLDIDVGREMSTLVKDMSAVWSAIDELRKIKNDLFFESLDDVVLEAFQ